MSPRACLALVGAVALAACGRLEVPDLSTGQVTGRLTGLGPGAGAYVYVLGDPDRKAAVAADGTFTIGDVAIGSRRLVAFDGQAKAAVVGPVEVRSAARAQLADVDAAAMPLAGRIVVAVRPPAGAGCTGVRLDAVGSDQRDVRGVQVGFGEGAVLAPLPAGDWEVRAALTGFRQAQALWVTVVGGASVPAEVSMEVEEAADPKGCQVSGCSNGLHCNAQDGQCYECSSDSQCESDDHCDLAIHRCVEGLPGRGGLCEAAAGVGECALGQWIPVGPSLGYCTSSCSSAADCPAGWGCDQGLCAVAQSCVAMTAAFGSACSRGDSTCSGALYGGKCLRADEDHPGFCTAPCVGDTGASNCPAGFQCRLQQPSGERWCYPSSGG